jgi:hypothetical protein
MMEVIVLPKRRFLQEPHGATSQNTLFFIMNVGVKIPVVSQSGRSFTRKYQRNSWENANQQDQSDGSGYIIVL